LLRAISAYCLHSTQIKWLGLSDAIAEGPVLSFKSVLRFRNMSVSYLGVYDARNPRADAFLNCFLLLNMGVPICRPHCDASGRCSLSNLSPTCAMEYRGIRYTIRARIERDEWSVAIHPGDVESAGKIITGDREQAESLAHSLIDKWLDRHQFR
jgi:hypothetical protein